jgi:hypothetical protein
MSQNNFEQPNNTEQKKLSDREKASKLEGLQHIKGVIESVKGHELEKGADMTSLINLGDTLEDFGMLDLSRRVKDEVIPKTIIVDIQDAMNVIEGNIDAAYAIFGHEVRKGSGFSSNENFNRSVSRFCITFALLMKDYGWAEGVYKFDLHDKEEAARMEKLKEESSNEDWKVTRNYVKEHGQEIIEGVQKAYSEFMETVKDSPENNVNLGELYLEIMKVIGEKIAELEQA